MVFNTYISYRYTVGDTVAEFMTVPVFWSQGHCGEFRMMAQVGTTGYFNCLGEKGLTSISLDVYLLYR